MLYRLTAWFPLIYEATANRGVYNAYDTYSPTTRIAVVEVLMQNRKIGERSYNRGIELVPVFDESGVQKCEARWYIQPQEQNELYMKAFATVTYIKGPPSNLLPKDLVNIYLMKEIGKRFHPLVGPTLATYDAFIKSLEGSSTLIWVKAFQTDESLVWAFYEDVKHGDKQTEVFDTQAEAFAFAATLQDN